MSVSDMRLMSDAMAMPMRPAGGPYYRGWHASPPRKSLQNHYYHHQQQPQQQQVPMKTDTEEHIIQPKTTVTTTMTSTSTTAAAGQNPNVRRANAIDRYSRVVFPVFFAVFSIVYWAAYVEASSSMVNLAGFVVD